MDDRNGGQTIQASEGGVCHARLLASHEECSLTFCGGRRGLRQDGCRLIPWWWRTPHSLQPREKGRSILLGGNSKRHCSVGREQCREKNSDAFADAAQARSLGLVTQTLLVAVLAHALAALVLVDFSLTSLLKRSHNVL